MKTKKILMPYIMFFMIYGCGKHDTNEVDTNTEEYVPIEASGDCNVQSFLEGVSRTDSYNGNTYIIKGIVLDKIEYGLKIRFEEDLKGNFPKNVNTFTVWGSNTPLNSFLNRMDDLNLYYKHDTLIMHITQARDLSGITPSGYKWVEKPNDYTTLACTYSVVKLSDGYVSRPVQFSLSDNYEMEVNTSPGICIETDIFTPNIKSASLIGKDKDIIDRQLSKYTAFTLDIKELVDYFHNNGGAGCVRFQIDEELDWTIWLQYNDMRATDYRAMYSTDEGDFEVNEPFVVTTFKGETSTGKHVRASIYEKTLSVYAIYGIDGSNFIIRNAFDYTNNREDETLIAYYTRDVIPIILRDNMPWEDFQKELNELLIINYN